MEKWHYLTQKYSDNCGGQLSGVFFFSFSLQNTIRSVFDMFVTDILQLRGWGGETRTPVNKGEGVLLYFWYKWGVIVWTYQSFSRSSRDRGCSHPIVNVSHLPYRWVTGKSGFLANNPVYLWRLNRNQQEKTVPLDITKRRRHRDSDLPNHDIYDRTH